MDSTSKKPEHYKEPDWLVNNASNGTICKAVYDKLCNIAEFGAEHIRLNVNGTSTICSVIDAVAVLGRRIEAANIEKERYCATTENALNYLDDNDIYETIEQLECLIQRRSVFRKPHLYGDGEGIVIDDMDALRHLIKVFKLVTNPSCKDEDDEYEPSFRKTVETMPDYEVITNLKDTLQYLINGINKKDDSWENRVNISLPPSIHDTDVLVNELARRIKKGIDKGTIKGKHLTKKAAIVNDAELKPDYKIEVLPPVPETLKQKFDAMTSDKDYTIEPETVRNLFVKITNFSNVVFDDDFKQDIQRAVLREHVFYYGTGNVLISVVEDNNDSKKIKIGVCDDLIRQLVDYKSQITE